jgi:hypothetical protein
VAVSPNEYWGDNKNNDAFEEHWLKKKHHTFVDSGTFYKNHVNKDPLKNYGDNEKSWYDDEMKRVLVLVGVDHRKAPDIVQDLEGGKRISVSMGCRIPYDVCSICKNEAPTRKEYCSHMKLEPGKIYPDGRKVFVYNPDPTFFDLSKVVRPAGHIEYMIKKIVPKEVEEGSKQASYLWVPRDNKEEYLAKVASMNSEELFEKEQEFADKFAQIDKACTMYKVIKGEPVTEEEMDPKLKDIVEKSKNIINLHKTEDLDDETLDKMSEFPLKKVFATSSILGIIPKLHEIVKMVMNRMGRGESDVEELTHNLDSHGWNPMDLLKDMDIFNNVKGQPKSIKIIIESKVMDGGVEDVDDKVAELLYPWMEKRSCYKPFLERRPFTKDAGALDLKPVWDDSGNQYLTTREAINNTGNEEAIKGITKAVGLAALMGVGGVAARTLPWIGGKYLIPAGIYGGYHLGDKAFDAFFNDPNLSTVPAYTVAKKVASMLPKEELVGLENLAQEPMNYMYPTMGLQPETMGSRLSRWASDNPAMAAFVGLAGAGLGMKGLSSAVKGLKGFVNPEVANIEKAMANTPHVIQSAEEAALKPGPALPVTQSKSVVMSPYESSHKRILEQVQKSMGNYVEPNQGVSVYDHNPVTGHGAFQEAQVRKVMGDKAYDQMVADLKFKQRPAKDMALDPYHRGRLDPINPKMASMRSKVLEILNK